MACSFTNNGGGEVSDNGVYVLKRLINESLDGYRMTAKQVCAVMGNFEIESPGFNPAKEIIDSDGKPSCGIMMWHAGFATEMKNWVTKKYGTWKSLQGQVDYFITCGSGMMAASRKKWVSHCQSSPGETIEQLAYYFRRYIEVAGGMDTQRQAAARMWYDWMSKNSIGDCNINVKSATNENDADKEVDPCEDARKDLNEALSAQDTAGGGDNNDVVMEGPVSPTLNIIMIIDKNFNGWFQQYRVPNDVAGRKVKIGKVTIKMKYNTYYQPVSNTATFGTLIRSALNQADSDVKLTCTPKQQLLIVLLCDVTSSGTSANAVCIKVVEILASIYKYFNKERFTVQPCVFMMDPYAPSSVNRLLKEISIWTLKGNVAGLLASIVASHFTGVTSRLSVPTFKHKTIGLGNDKMGLMSYRTLAVAEALMAYKKRIKNFIVSLGKKNDRTVESWLLGDSGSGDSLEDWLLNR